jgi:DNA repair exonuclease SbcCD ATPase subunit
MQAQAAQPRKRRFDQRQSPQQQQKPSREAFPLRKIAKRGTPQAEDEYEDEYEEADLYADVNAIDASEDVLKSFASFGLSAETGSLADSARGSRTTDGLLSESMRLRRSAEEASKLALYRYIRMLNMGRAAKRGDYQESPSLAGLSDEYSEGYRGLHREAEDPSSEIKSLRRVREALERKNREQEIELHALERDNARLAKAAVLSESAANEQARRAQKIEHKREETLRRLSETEQKLESARRAGASRRGDQQLQLQNEADPAAQLALANRKIDRLARQAEELQSERDRERESAQLLDLELKKLQKQLKEMDKKHTKQLEKLAAQIGYEADYSDELNALRERNAGLQREIDDQAAALVEAQKYIEASSLARNQAGADRFGGEELQTLRTAIEVLGDIAILASQLPEQVEKATTLKHELEWRLFTSLARIGRLEDNEGSWSFAATNEQDYRAWAADILSSDNNQPVAQALSVPNAVIATAAAQIQSLRELVQGRGAESPPRALAESLAVKLQAAASLFKRETDNVGAVYTQWARPWKQLQEISTLLAQQRYNDVAANYAESAVKAAVAIEIMRRASIFYWAANGQPYPLDLLYDTFAMQPSPMDVKDTLKSWGDGSDRVFGFVFCEPAAWVQPIFGDSVTSSCREEDHDAEEIVDKSMQLFFSFTSPPWEIAAPLQGGG